MSKCGYFCLEKGKAVCKHPENGEMWTKNGIQSYGSNRCDQCRYICGGLYPSELPVVDFRNCKADVIDSAGNVVS